jgi:hypothetical protein
MKTTIKPLLLLIVLATCSTIFGQSKVALEQIQIYSSFHNNANYWRLPANISPLINALDSGVFAILSIERDNNYPTKKRELTKQNQVGKINIDWTISKNIPYHAYLEIYEMDPEAVYNNGLITVAESKKDSIQSIWFIGCSIFDAQQRKVFQKTIALGLMPFSTLGFGVTNIDVPTTPTLLYDALTKGISLLDPNAEDITFVEAKVPAVYATDNYWMPMLQTTPRIQFDTTKKYLSFRDNKGAQILRVPNAILNKIETKNSKVNSQFAPIVNQIKLNRKNYSRNEYYQAIQPLRDVNENKDYTLVSVLEFNPFMSETSEASKMGISFLPELPHYIYENKDSIGQFKVSESVVEKDKYYFPNMAYNGYDSTTQFIVDFNNAAKVSIVHNRVVEGFIKNRSFTIQYNYNISQKSIFVDNKIWVVIGGDLKPQKMVNFSSNIKDDNELKNLLILIAQSEIFKNPN